MRDHSTEEFEDILRDKTQQYMMYPSDRVWDNVLHKLHPLRRVKNVAILLLFFIAATTAIILSSEEAKYAMNKTVKINQSLIAKNQLTETAMRPVRSTATTEVKQVKKRAISLSVNENGKPAEPAQKAQIELIVNNPILEIPTQISENTSNMPVITSTENMTQGKKEDKNHHVSTIVENVIEQANKIKKNSNWQFYVTPTISYRNLSGHASNASYQYSQYFMSTNAPFATDVRDAVNHQPGLGLEIGTSLFYPITKRLTFKAGIQANYNHYLIKAFSSIPEIATYGMNNFSGATIPIGFDYRVLGNKKVNLSIASTMQPSYVFANYSYLISTNLKNYAKAPSLNRNLNVNGAVEASINITTSRSLTWSIAPQYRYQMFSSFKNKYPIRENLMDFGIKFGVIKSIK